MKRNFVGLIFTTLIAITNPSFAQDNIRIEVFTDYKDAAAIGFRVKGENQGSLGNRTKSKGPANETYYFGIRCGSIFGKDLSCGSIFLSTASKIRLVVDGDVCVAELVSSESQSLD